MFLQLILHWLGDYVLQSDWMALNKAKNTFICMVHCALYSLPFGLFLPLHASQMLFILLSHFLIDRFGLARYIIWIKNHLNPELKYYPWIICTKTGYRDGPMEGFGTLVDQSCGIRPYFLTIWLLIITDNGLHIICNYLAINCL
jgi:hypothetical protein